VLWRVKEFPAGPVRVALREQEPLAHDPVTFRLDVPPRGPVELAERVQALASAAAAIERAAASVDMAISFFMVAVSLMGEGCRCGSHAGETGRAVSARYLWRETVGIVLSTRCNSV
jgi:hypothetical protein